MLKNILLVGMLSSLVFACTDSKFSGDKNSAFLDPDCGEDECGKDTEYDIEDGDLISVTDNPRVTVGEYIDKNFEPLSITTRRIENKGQVANLILSIYSINGQKVSSKVSNDSKTKIAFPKVGTTIETLNKLCPAVETGRVVLNLEIEIVGSATIKASNRQDILGARAGSKTGSVNVVHVGVEDPDGAAYEFHNVDSFIAKLECPNAKSLHVKDLCYDKVLDDETMLKCWAIEGANSSCKNNNIYKDGSYPAQCK